MENRLSKVSLEYFVIHSMRRGI